MMQLFLNRVSQDFQGYFIIMLMDRAGWHVSCHLSMPENIRIICQPAHSPELNPVEHISDELRGKYFVNRVLKSLDDVENALCKGLYHLMHNPNYVKSLNDFQFMNVTL